MTSEEIINKDWDNFTKWIYTEKQIVPGGWMPDKQSIKLWLEFKEKK